MEELGNITLLHSETQLRLHHRFNTICVVVQSKYRSSPRLDKQTQENANSTLEPSNFYKKKVSFLCSRMNISNPPSQNLKSKKWPSYRRRVMKCVRQLSTIDDATWFPDKRAPVLRVLASWPAEDRGCNPPIVSLNMCRVRDIMDKGNLLADQLNKECTRAAKRKHIEAKVATSKDVEAEVIAGRNTRAGKRRRGC